MRPVRAAGLATQNRNIAKHRHQPSSLLERNPSRDTNQNAAKSVRWMRAELKRKLDGDPIWLSLLCSGILLYKSYLSRKSIIQKGDARGNPSTPIEPNKSIYLIEFNDSYCLMSISIRYRLNNTVNRSFLLCTGILWWNFMDQAGLISTAWLRWNSCPTVRAAQTPQCEMSILATLGRRLTTGHSQQNLNGLTGSGWRLMLMNFICENSMGTGFRHFEWQTKIELKKSCR